MQKARENVPSDMRAPSIDQAVIDIWFALTWPYWEFNSVKGKCHQKVFYQALLSGLQGATLWPINLTKVHEVKKGPDKSPAEYLEWLLEAFPQCTPYDHSRQ